MFSNLSENILEFFWGENKVKAVHDDQHAETPLSAEEKEYGATTRGGGSGAFQFFFSRTKLSPHYSSRT